MDLVGWAGSAVLVWSLLQSRVLRLRALNLVGSVVLIGYNAALEVWPMVGLNVVLAAINIWYLRGMLATRHDEKTYQVVEVGVGDQFLAHTLRVHAADIAGSTLTSTGTRRSRDAPRSWWSRPTRWWGWCCRTPRRTASPRSTWTT